MLSVSRLLGGTVTPQDALRYGRTSARGPAHLLHFSILDQGRDPRDATLSLDALLQ